MNSIERVRRARDCNNPDKTPLFLPNRDFGDSDILNIGVVDTAVEWGFEWERIDETMGQVKEPIIKNWEDFKMFIPPKADKAGRFDWTSSYMENIPNKYNLVSLGISGFTIMCFLRGMAELLCDFYEEEENVNKLADMVFGFEEDIIKLLPGKGFHGVSFADDWGTQHGPIISPELWHSFFAPRYKRQFDLCHKNGLDVYFHSCGSYLPLIEGFIDIGVDFMNISQPNLYDMKELGRRFGGKVCFVCPVSYQTTSLSGTREEIFADVKLMHENLAVGGGLVGYVEDYPSIGLSETNYQACIEAFNKKGIM